MTIQGTRSGFRANILADFWAKIREAIMGFWNRGLANFWSDFGSFPCILLKCHVDLYLGPILGLILGPKLGTQIRAIFGLIFLLLELIFGAGKPIELPPCCHYPRDRFPCLHRLHQRVLPRPSFSFLHHRRA